MAKFKDSMNHIVEATANVVSSIFLTTGWVAIVFSMAVLPVLSLFYIKDVVMNTKEQNLPPCIEVTIEEDDHGPLVEKIGPYLNQGYVVSIVWPHEESMSSTVCFQKWDGQQQKVRKNHGK
jgi:hypothetical protein